jgi:hypothetical protein
MAHKKWLYPIEIKELFYTYLRTGIIYLMGDLRIGITYRHFEERLCELA